MPTSARPHHLRAILTGVLATAAVAVVGVGIGITAAQAAEPADGDTGHRTTEVRAIDADADFYLGIARTTAAEAAGKVATTGLQVRIDQLENAEELREDTVEALVDQLRVSTRVTGANLQAWEQQQAEAAAAAAAAVEALARANTPEGAHETARAMAAEQYGWGEGQFSCLHSLWTKESSWQFQAENPSSGAYGIPQSLPGDKMASFGADWQTNAATQIAWGLDYISRGYGTPCSAWAHSQATDWY